ncbi:SHOCT domain-containing protein [Halorussus litoreus]|uniref:SHOCT domain-containing protein n=1 Tax=Halorussus litoreus TaxID=1710536 RepID=UPI000E250988|nr:SHOCT domain-containing protein [Halorussus litoreus]
MGLRDDTRVTLLLAGLVLSLFALVGVVAFGMLAVVSAVLAPPAGTPLLVALLNAVVPYALAGAFFGMLSLLLLIWTTAAAVRRASMPRSERLASLARTAERHSSEARELGLAERFEPTTEERIEALKAEYVDGEITEYEYEQRLQRLLREADVRSGFESVTDDHVQRELDRLRGERDRGESEFER